MTDDRRRDRELMREALETIEQLQVRLRARSELRSEPLAIVGVGCRFPGASDPKAFWRLLREGRDAITEVPPTRWDVDAWYDPDPDAAGKVSTRFGGFLDGVETFDAAFFGITPREARSLDPQQRLLLETAWAALESAGIPPDSLRDSAGGVFVGIGGVDYFRRLAARPPDEIDAYMASGNAHSTASGRLSFQLGLRGPSLSVDTACSSSLVAVHLACQSLRRGECDLALAAGANVMLCPEVHVNHSRARMLAPDGRCKAFDSAADGFVRSEGCGVVVLKRMSDALRDRDPVLAVIRGSAVNQDGRTAALTVPNGPAQTEVMRAALREAQIEAAGVSYVESHGTGTALGDPIEAGALAEVFGGGRESPLLVGSVKTNVGHTEAAAGVAGLIKVVLALQAEEIPPHLHYQTPNPLIPQLAGDTPTLRIPTRVTPWAADGRTRVAGVSSFGFSGTNAHVLVEAPPANGIGATPSQAADTGWASAAGSDHRLLLLSARTPRALGVLAGRYRALLDTLAPAPDKGTEERPASSDTVALGDLCAGAATDRTHFRQRVALRAETPTALADRLEAVESGTGAAGVWSGHADSEGGTAFLFTGQGAQYPGMARTLHETCEPFREAVAGCAMHLDRQLPCRLTDLLYGDRAATQLARTEYAQPALFTLEYAMSRMWAALGVEPDAVLGHSVGEYVAACVAGVIGLEDACRLVAERGRLMQRQVPGEMAAVMCRADRAEAIVAGYPAVSVAAFNGPDHVVISGPAEPVAACLADAERAGIAVRRLEVSHAFHSAMMEPMLDAFARVTATVSYRDPTLLLVANVSGMVAGCEVSRPEYWVEQVRRPVRFADGMRTLWDQGCRWFLEMGPTATLSSLARACVATGADPADTPGIFVPSLRRGRPDWAVLSEAAARLHVSGRRVDWRPWYGAGHRHVALPTYPFERKRFWVDAATASPDTRVDLEDHYEVRWDEVDVPTAAPRPDRGRLWILLADKGGTADAIARSLRTHGDEVAMVLAAGAWAREGERWWIDPDRADQYQRVLQEAGGATQVAGVLYLWGLDSPTTEELGSEGLERATVTGCSRLVRMLAAMTDGGVASGARLWVVTCGVVPAVAEDRTLQVAQSPLWGLGKVACLEHPAHWGGLVDLDPWSPDPAALPALFDATGRDQTAIRGGRLYAPRLARVPLSAGSVKLQSQATYLITGGLGALGLEVAGRLVARGARHLVLVGRRSPGESARDGIARLTDAGATVRTEQLNLGDPPAVRAFMEGLVSSGLPLRGIVHAAGVTTSSPVCELDAEALRLAMEAKIVGAWLLHEATRERELDFFVLFSSIASVWGSKGQGHYAAANEFLDRLAQLRTRLGLPGLSIGWGPWADRGMATAGAREWLERVGVRALAPDTALNMFESLLNTPGHAVIADIDWPRFLDIYQSRRQSVLFRELAADSPSPAAVTAKPAMQATGDSVESLRARGPVEGRRALVRLVRERVATVMEVSPDELPAPGQGFFSSGLDSLMALELRAQLSEALGVTLGSTLAFDHPSLADLTEHLAGEIFGAGADADRDRAETGPVGQEHELESASAGSDLESEVKAAIRRFERLGK
ncbi:MAG: type I polyketide synthase [Vicinamibacterales bacterium]|jgi:acyl transferase domain-containing protein/acyl carrier protein|nr:type I polyketide synthase [Vicinamibacterales bacterium]